MTRIDVTIPTPDGSCPASMHVPAAPGPAVILFQDAGGVRETMAGMADRLAGLGYVTLLPDLYYRWAPVAPFDLATVFSVPEEWDRLMTLATSITADMIVSDAGAFLEFLGARDEVVGTGVGTTGYCMGGRLSLQVAAGHPERIAAAASFHGGGIGADVPGSPALVADRIRAAVYVAAAENDASCPPEQLERLEKALTAAGVTHDVETYPAAHGFAVPDNPTYDAAADARHWAALERLYGSALGQ